MESGLHVRTILSVLLEVIVITVDLGPAYSRKSVHREVIPVLIIPVIRRAYPSSGNHLTCVRIEVIPVALNIEHTVSVSIGLSCHGEVIPFAVYLMPAAFQSLAGGIEIIPVACIYFVAVAVSLNVIVIPAGYHGTVLIECIEI